MGAYDVAQICVNGHLITDSAARYPQHRQKFCEKCGAAAIMACAACGASIRGDYHAEGVISFTSDYKVPAFCLECGRPYPWTAEQLRAGEELIDLAEHLSEQDRESLKAILPALSVDSPRTQVAIVRMRSFLSKAKAELVPAMKSVLTSIATDTVKKSLGL